MTQKQFPEIGSALPRLILSRIVGLLYAAACINPAIEFAKESPSRDFGDIRIFPDWEAGSHIGLTALAFGWAPPWTVPWSANLFLLAGWILLMCKKNTWRWVSAWLRPSLA